MSFGVAIIWLAMRMALSGFVAEVFAVAGTAFYSVLRVLPFNSPFDLQSLGCWCLLAGAVLFIAGWLLR